ncbi:MAG TPA: hypothetical protein PKA00_23485 [Saprospiraceae bacterium]|nr:hypothetical protein [Saprospiraceae bacterium]HMQ85892.1 hypothetical protein [Saprospiraceae bacterium]
MKDYLLNRQLERIEREAGNDFLQIRSFGAHCYTTRELQELLMRLQREEQKMIQYRNFIYIIGATSSVWIGLSMIAFSFQYFLIQYLALFLIFFSVLTFIVGLFTLKRKFSVASAADEIEVIIREELERRRKDASIF